MRKSFPNQAVSLLLSFAMLLGINWYYFNSIPKQNLDKYTLATTIDTTVFQLKVQQFNERGELSSFLTTPLMEHIPKDDIHLLKTPHISIKEGNQPAWAIDSLKAKSYLGGEYIVFMDKVIVRQKARGSNEESMLKTEEVTYYPKEKKATTSLFVTFEQPGQRVESTGMNAYLEEKRVELLHAAKGSYAPAQKG